MRPPLAGTLVVTQLYGSLRGGVGEAYTAVHNGITTHCIGHAGMDFAAPSGSPVFAMKEGKVHWPPATDGYRTALGIYAILTDSPGEGFWYAHLSLAAAGEGVWVPAGTLIGYSGYSGNVSPPGVAGAHLHVAKRPAVPDFGSGFDGFVPFMHQFDHDVYTQGLLDLSLV